MYLAGKQRASESRKSGWRGGREETGRRRNIVGVSRKRDVKVQDAKSTAATVGARVESKHATLTAWEREREREREEARAKRPLVRAEMHFPAGEELFFFEYDKYFGRALGAGGIFVFFRSSWNLGVEGFVKSGKIVAKWGWFRKCMSLRVGFLFILLIVRDYETLRAYCILYFHICSSNKLLVKIKNIFL